MKDETYKLYVTSYRKIGVKMLLKFEKRDILLIYAVSSFTLFSINSACAKLTDNYHLQAVQDILGDRSDLPMHLVDFAKADTVTVMIKAPGVSFRRRIDENELANVACIYQAHAEKIPQIIKILDSDIVKFKIGNVERTETRIEISFTRNSEPLALLFSEDWAGLHIVNGHYEKYAILASSDISNDIHLWTQEGGVSLLDQSRHGCR